MAPTTVVRLQTVTEALRGLTAPTEVTVVSQASRENVLLQTLSCNLSAFRQKLLQDPDILTLRQLRENVMTQFTLPLNSDDIVWNFVAEALVLLLCLKQAMIDVLAQFTPPKRNPKSPECAPPLSPDTLSISQQKTVQSALQFVVTLGICPYLLPGVGVPLRCRSEFAVTVEKMVGHFMPADGTWRLHTVTQVLLTIAGHPSLESLVFSGHLGDLIASLCQLGYLPIKGQQDSVLGKGLPGYRASQKVIELFHMMDTLTARQFQRVATTTLLSMVKEQPNLADRHLLRPLLAPLVTCLRTEGMAEESGQEEVVIVGELELTRSVEDVYKVCVVGNDPLPRLMESLEGVIRAIFNLYCFTKQGVSHLRTPCQEILLWFFQKSETKVALQMLKQLAGLLPLIPSLQPLNQFTAGSEGGVKLISKRTVSDDDEVLYGKVYWDQWRAECLADLLSSLKESNIAGDFFIECLKGLACLAGGANCTSAPNCTGDLPDLQQQQLITVQLVAVMCEKIGHSVFSNTVQVIEFIVATLERSCMSMVHRTEEMVEAQTLSMGMGLIAAMLGGAVQLTSKDFVAMKSMLSLLTQLSATHPDPVIQELASDLRITIATHGAFSTQVVSEAAHCTMGNKTEGANRCIDPGRAAKASAVIEDREVSTSDMAVQPEARSSSSSQFHHIFEAAFDPEVSTRAAAIRTLTQLIQQHNPDALRNQEKILTVFLENLNHEDSFVYLSAIQGVSVLSDMYPARILPELLNKYQISPEETEKKQSVEARMKIGEVLMRSTRALGEMASHYRDQLIHVYLMGTRDSDSSLRASSLSNLGELCSCLDFAVGSVIHEVTACLSAMVKTEHEAEVRRAAIHVITLLLRGLCEKALQVLGDVLRDLYHLLKFAARTDVDQLVQLHAQLALEELDHVVKRVLFPEEKLEKKIMILP
ncbi:transport and Golgi organization protein 6 homolog isoform X3 [Narcine bancroftii]|uniref:transport and Golgi organization protein 6 homolog isoform X3 n=1 Tax=Narcine bancroftii TaxID=1343680 RepID=UPI00383174EC